MKMLPHLVCPFLRTCLGLLLLTPMASPVLMATDLSYQKLFGRWTGFPAGSPPVGYGIGADLNTAAKSEKWIVVGDAGAAERGQPVEGGVQVFNAVTGAWVRKLLPPLPATATQRFGGAVAISGDIALVGEL
ncbi:MAG: hypothetical protein KDM63_06245 [Verrucomicrobiae bacterium]|nr:hypothetical protein [Verrucomicrobiae bacterium]